MLLSSTSKTRAARSTAWRATSSKGEGAAADPSARLKETAAAITAGVERALPGWVERQVGRILDAWDRASVDDRRRTEAAATGAGTQAAVRVGRELTALFALDVVKQQATPLEIVRTAYREPTEVLRAAGVPPVVRDAFDERAWPDDDYGLVPRTLGDLGDELGPLHLAWGMAKAAVVRARRTPPKAAE
jgi:hypothetical protein